MNVTRINSMEFDNEKALKKRMKNYRKKAREQFPEAELLMIVRTSPKTLIAISAYPDKEAADRADKIRAKRVSTLKKGTSWHMEGQVEFFDLKNETSSEKLNAFD